MRISKKAAKKAGIKIPRANKYRNVKTTIDGITFASKKEAKRYSELSILLRCGKISDLVVQPEYPIYVNDNLVTTYIADFSYLDESSRVTVEDVKGVRTPIYLLKKRMVKAYYNIDINEI